MRSLKTLLLTLALAGAATSVRAITFEAPWIDGMYVLPTSYPSTFTSPVVGYTAVGNTTPTNLQGEVTPTTFPDGTSGMTGAYGAIGTLAGNTGIVFYNVGNALTFAGMVGSAADKTLRLTVYNDGSQDWKVGLWYSLYLNPDTSSLGRSYPYNPIKSTAVTTTAGSPASPYNLTFDLSSVDASKISGIGFYVENPLSSSGTYRISLSPTVAAPVPESGSVALLVGGALVGCLGLRRRYVRG